MPVEGRAGVDEPVEGKQVAHGSHGIVEKYVHIPPMDLTYQMAPVLNIAMVTIEESEIQWPKAVARPRSIDERTSYKVESLSIFVSSRHARMAQKITLIPSPWM